jgi:hypothetical protein
MTMQSFVRNALIGAALLGAPGLVTSTLPASACDCTNCSAEHCLPPPHPNDDPSAGSCSDQVEADLFLIAVARKTQAGLSHCAIMQSP